VLENEERPADSFEETPQPTPLRNDFITFEYSDSYQTKILMMRSFQPMWYSNWMFFGHGSAKPKFHGTINQRGGENFALSSGLRNSLLFADRMTRLLVSELHQSGVNRGSYNMFTTLFYSESDEFFEKFMDNRGEFVSALLPIANAEDARARRKIGVRRSLVDDSKTSAEEAYMTLTAASTGLGPVVHAAGIVNDHSVFVMDAHTPLSDLMRPVVVGGMRFPPRPAVSGLDAAVGAAFARVAERGLLMLDSKPANLVVDLSGDSPNILAIDYDPLFCAYQPQAESRCVFVVNATMFLLSIPEQCISEKGVDANSNLMTYRPINDLQMRLRAAIDEIGANGLCAALKKQLFHNRVRPFTIIGRADTDTIARSIVFLANHYAKFDGGSESNTKCPINGLKFDEPIWPQLLGHVLRMQATPVTDEEIAENFRRALMTPAK
jgi:hypothetical protein